MSSITYQPHVDGLRALAVLSVFIFHLEAQYLPGGFLGVDIFFVISGYLITSIIYKQKSAGTFSFKQFYKRRAKRILPPLFFVLFLVLSAGYVLLLPYDFYKLGISAISVVTFVANMQYSLRTGDYFSGDSSEWPLLNTWSLSVEEQYYFIFPALLFALLVYAPKRVNLILTIILLVSFSLAEFMSRTKGFQSYSYYLIVSRMGELLVGSLLALLQAHKTITLNRSSLVSAAAVAGVFVMFFLVDETTVFPGFSAFLLCILTALIINSKNRFTEIVFETRPVIFIGLISYSLYLFHWPVLAFFRYIESNNTGGTTLPYGDQVLATVLIIVLSLVSYFYVETPLRKRHTGTAKTFSYYFVAPTVVVLLVTASIIRFDGLPARLDTPTVFAKYQFNHIDSAKCPGHIQLGCTGGDPQSEKLALFYGNSHGEHYFEYISTLSAHYDYRVQLFAKGGCSLVKSNYACDKVRSAFEQALNDSKPDVVILAFRWDTGIKKAGVLDELETLIHLEQTSSQRVVVLAQPPLLDSNPAKIANCERLALDCTAKIRFSDAYPDYNNIVKDVTLKAGADFFDPFDYVGDRYSFKQEERYYYYDRDHLNIYGNRWLAKSYEETNSNAFLQ